MSLAMTSVPRNFCMSQALVTSSFVQTRSGMHLLVPRAVSMVRQA